MAGVEVWAWEILCYCFIFFAGLLGNLTVIIVVLKTSSQKNRFREIPFNLYLMALAFIDLTSAVTCMPIYLLSSSAFDHPTGTSGDILCKLVTGYLIPFWLCDASIYMLVLISFERYAAICKPLQSLHVGTQRKTYFFIFGASIAAFIVQIPTIVGVKRAGVNSTGGYCTYDWPSDAVSTAIFGAVLCCHFVIPATVFIVNFHRTKKCLTRFDRNLQRTIGDNRQRVKIMKSKEKTVRIVFVVTMAFFVLWAPNHVMYFLLQFGGYNSQLKWNSIYYQAGIILGFCSSWVNPFLYAFQSQDFQVHCRRVFWKLLGGRLISRPRDSSQSGSSVRRHRPSEM